MVHYDPDLTLAAARDLYFESNGFGADGGYGRWWVTGKIGPIPFAFPNTQAHVRAVRFHDLHHLVTGYDTDFVGEAQIAAWEIASGCGRHAAAWLINLGGLFVGLFFDVDAVFRAFLRGKQSRNLYRREYTDALLAETVGATRGALALDAPLPREPTTADRAAFAVWAALGAITTLAVLLVSFSPLIALAVWLL